MFVIKPESINHTLIITNRQSSKLKKIDESKFDSMVFEPLENLGIKYDVINRPSDLTLDKIVEEDSLLVICGGDGTVTRIVNYATKNSLLNTLLPLPFGGANDIATGLYNNTPLSEIITTGEPDKAYTIEAIIQKENLKQKTIRALGYIGIGASGHAAKAINNYQNSSSTELGAIAHATQSVLKCGVFSYLDSNGIRKNATEILSINHRMARYIQTSEITTFNPEFMSIEITNKIQMLGKVCLGLITKTTGTKIENNQNLLLQTLTPTALQADGESIDIEPKTKILIKNGPAINMVRI